MMKEGKTVQLEGGSEVTEERYKPGEYWKDIKKNEMRRDNRSTLKDYLIFQIGLLWK